MIPTKSSGSPEQLQKLKKSDFETQNDVRWCPGCGDYAILAAVQRFLPSLGLSPDKYVFVSGIGCSSRFPYYMNTYGFHTIHGRAPAVASGVKLSNPELPVWMITGDGDALSIGGNHFIHLLRRNVDINVLLFNNKIYGLTKGQYSPTSEIGKVTKSTPMGSADTPVNPLELALGAQGSFIARSLDVDAKHLISVLEAASAHRGTSFIEIFQNCNIFNDGTHEYMAERSVRTERQLQLVDGELLIFGKERDKGIRITESCTPEVVEFTPGDESEAEAKGILRYDKHNINLARIIACLEYPDFPVPMGIVYEQERPSFEELLSNQEKQAKQKKPLSDSANENLKQLFHSGDTWEVQ